METKTFNQDFWYENQTQQKFYVEDLKLKIHFYSGSLTLLDITNACGLDLEDRNVCVESG